MPLFEEFGSADSDHAKLFGSVTATGTISDSSTTFCKPPN